MAHVALVAVDKATMAFDRLFSYLIPDALADGAVPGCRVLVSFGAGNNKRQGMIFEVREGEPQGAFKPILMVLDPAPLLSGELLALAAHLRETVFCTYYEAVRLMIPAGLDTKIEQKYLPAQDAPMQPLSGEEARVDAFLREAGRPVGEQAVLSQLELRDNRALLSLFRKGVLVREEDIRRRVMDEKITMVRLCATEIAPKLTQKQKAVASFLEEAGAASLKETCYYAAVTRVVVDNMRGKGLVEYYDREIYRNPYRDKTFTRGADIVLSPTQQEAFESLKRTQAEGAYAVSLLYGVTGSGKTQVFLRLAQEVVAGGRGVLVLVPEISLTPQTIAGFHAYFGDKVALIHSALSLGERLDEYKRIQRGEASVVVGTRSAVFAPVRNLGLIIIDEEQEQSYKSEKSPRFHARDVAKWRVHYHATQLVLASATPSVESFYHAQRGAYRLVRLQGRYSGAVLPDVYVLDMAEGEAASASAVLSQRLCDELYLNLEAGEQSILLLNRRGYHTLVKCRECGEAAVCPNCSVALTFHAANNALCCHYCGYIQPRDTVCPLCGGTYARYQGAGTQRVEEELHTLFPKARVLRMDMDTTMHKFSHEELFGAFAAHAYDIMVGTQMVAKGLNFPDVTLVGVLCTDQALYSDDFRSFERTFSLITQVVGRAGRSLKRGRAFIQTYSPDNPVIELASTQQYERFFQGEIGARKLGLYPPFCDICAIGVTSLSEEAARSGAQKLLDFLRAAARERYADIPLRVLGPSDFALYKMAGKFRRKLLLKCRSTPRLRALLREVLEYAAKNRESRQVSVFIDMYYDSF